MRIAVKAAGANFPDLLMTRGGYQLRPDLPFVPGMEVAGDILEVGTDVTGFKAGGFTSLDPKFHRSLTSYSKLLSFLLLLGKSMD